MLEHLNAENAVLGSILLDGSCLEAVRAIVTPEDFQSQRGEDLFRAACRLMDRGGAVDPVLLVAEAGGGAELEAWALELMQLTPTAVNAPVYAEQLARSGAKRQLREALEDGLERLREGDKPRAVCGDLQGGLERIAQRDCTGGLISACDALTDFAQYRAALGKGSGVGTVKLGYETVDKLLGGGMVSEGLYILAARPGIGKTTLALNMAETMAKAGVPVLFVSLEMSLRQLTAKRLAMETGLPAWQILNDAQLTAADERKLLRASAALADRPLQFNRWPHAGVEDIGFLARQVKGLGAVVVDYLGLIQCREGRSLYEKITYTSGALKKLARRLGVPILCLAQLNRESEGQRPRLSDLRDSGAVEQDADGVMLLHCPQGRPKSIDGVTPAELTLILEKNRHGSTGDVGLSFYLSSGRIKQIWTGR